MKRSGLRKAFNKGPILASQYWSVVGLRVAREYFVIDLNCILDFYNIKNFYLDNFILISNNKKNYSGLKMAIDKGPTLASQCRSLNGSRAAG